MLNKIHINKTIVHLYKILPGNIKKAIGRSLFFKGIRNKLLYNKRGFESTIVQVKRSYSHYLVDFQFCAALKVASAAKYHGIENTVLRNAFSLIDTYKPGREDLNVIDIGANFGYLSMVWTKSIAKNGRTIAFEPNKNIFTCIEETKNINNLQDCLEVHNLAVGNENKTITLSVSQLSSNSKPMENSIQEYDIDMVTLDTFLKKQQKKSIDMIKIDVDGIELEILEGAKETLKFNDVITIVETNDDSKIIDFFRSINYEVFNMKLEPYLLGQQIPLNVFCIPEKLINNAI